MLFNDDNDFVQFIDALKAARSGGGLNSIHEEILEDIISGAQAKLEQQDAIQNDQRLLSAFREQRVAMGRAWEKAVGKISPESFQSVGFIDLFLQDLEEFKKDLNSAEDDIRDIEDATSMATLSSEDYGAFQKRMAEIKPEDSYFQKIHEWKAVPNAPVFQSQESALLAKMLGNMKKFEQSDTVNWFAYYAKALEERNPEKILSYWKTSKTHDVFGQAPYDEFPVSMGNVIASVHRDYVSKNAGQAQQGDKKRVRIQ